MSACTGTIRKVSGTNEFSIGREGDSFKDLYVYTANDKPRNPGRNLFLYSRFYVIAMSSCTSWVGVCCSLLNLSMDNSTVLGFHDTSGDYRSFKMPFREEEVAEIFLSVHVLAS